ncbi:hypothetical protein QL285_064382 [Trifolium repens]|nr:hypothetical protein QL285_064382 [Trifolium repens]
MIDTAGANENDTRRERLWKRRVRVRFRRREERGLRRRLRDAEQMKQDNYRKKKRDASDTLKLSNMDDFEAQSQFQQRLSWKFNRNRLTIWTEACKLASNDAPVFLAAILEYLATEGDTNDHESIVKAINRHITKKLSSKFCICRLVWNLVNENKLMALLVW